MKHLKNKVELIKCAK